MFLVYKENDKVGKRNKWIEKMRRVRSKVRAVIGGVISVNWYRKTSPPIRISMNKIQVELKNNDRNEKNPTLIFSSNKSRLFKNKINDDFTKNALLQMSSNKSNAST